MKNPNAKESKAFVNSFIGLGNHVVSCWDKSENNGINEK